MDIDIQISSILATICLKLKFEILRPFDENVKSVCVSVSIFFEVCDVLVVKGSFSISQVAGASHVICSTDETTQGLESTCIGSSIFVLL